VLKLTANQQPALVAAAAAAFAAYQEAGGKLPNYAAGHSLGEFSAHVAAGSLTLEHALNLVRKRGEYMQEAVPEGLGAMAAIMKLNPAEVERVCYDTEGVVEVANFNSPEQTVISGEAEAVARATERLKERKARVIPLKVSAPFHCSLMRPAAEKLAADLAAVSFKQPAFKILCNVTADILRTPQDAPALLERQVTAPVRWLESILKLQDLGVHRFLEFGSGKVLTGLIGRILEDAKALAVTDMASLQEAL
jgi:[acyl-carrier-protein] S-malonyltransferase